MNNQEKFEKIFAVTVEVKKNEDGTRTEISLPVEWWNAESKKHWSKANNGEI